MDSHRERKTAFVSHNASARRGSFLVLGQRLANAPGSEDENLAAAYWHFDVPIIVHASERAVQVSVTLGLTIVRLASLRSRP